MRLYTFFVTPPPLTRRYLRSENVDNSGWPLRKIPIKRLKILSIIVLLDNLLVKMYLLKVHYLSEKTLMDITRAQY